VAIQFKNRIDLSALKGVKKKLQDLGRGLTQSEADEVGRKALSEMKSLISRGVSPISGGGYGGKFPAYKNPDKYPGKRKSKTPVNLKLKGDFLDDLDYSVVKGKSGYAAEIGYSSPKEKLKEKGHREGANGQPERPTIPIFNRGEKFARSIQDAFLKVVFDAVDKVARRKD
jgi:hypothetical protein